MHKKYLTTLAMAAIALSPLFVMKAASLTDLSQAYPLPRTNIDLDLNTDLEVDADTSMEIDAETAVDINDVSTEADLKAFTLSKIQEDENIESIDFENDSVEVSYKGKGRFIGIIPVEMDVDVEVDQEGEVEFDYPWYGFLVVKDKADLEALIEAEVETALASEAQDGWTNYDRARIAASIVAALKAHYESKTATTTDAEV